METKRIQTADGTIVHYLEIKGINKFHSWDSAAFIPQGNKRLAEYYLYGIQYSKDEWMNRKSDVNGIPFHKTAAGKQTGTRV